MSKQSGRPNFDGALSTAAVQANSHSDEPLGDEPLLTPAGDAMSTFRDALEEGAREESTSADNERGSPIDPGIRLIAERVRRWREEADLTLQELARRSRVAASTIQKVETLQMVPTVGVLLKIARGLDRPPSELVRETSEELQAVHLPPEMRHPIGLSTHLTMERLVGDLFEPIIEAWRVTTRPGAGSGRDPVRWDSEALIVCELGELTFYVGEDVHTIRAGDTFHYKTTTPHIWRNEGDTDARFVIVTTLPHKLRKILHESIRQGDPATTLEPVSKN
jgi:transcriptional regulator with XRE-family HTH domain